MHQPSARCVGGAGNRVQDEAEANWCRRRSDGWNLEHHRGAEFIWLVRAVHRALCDVEMLKHDQAEHVPAETLLVPAIARRNRGAAASSRNH